MTEPYQSEYGNLFQNMGIFLRIWESFSDTYITEQRLLHNIYTAQPKHYLAEIYLYLPYR